jgi:CII-binding regulator of phage lambda lysogenization HflD
MRCAMQQRNCVMPETTEMTPRATQMERHLQTLIVLILTGLLVWVGTTVQSTQVEVAKLSVELAFLKDSLNKDNGKFEAIEQRLDRIEQALAKQNKDE